MPVLLPISGDYTAPQGFRSFKVKFIDTIYACSTGKEVENHVKLFQVAKLNPASKIIICLSSYRLDKVVQDEIRFCHLMYGTKCLNQMIFVVTKRDAKIGKRLLNELNYGRLEG